MLANKRSPAIYTRAIHNRHAPKEKFHSSVPTDIKLDIIKIISNGQVKPFVNLLSSCTSYLPGMYHSFTLLKNLKRVDTISKR